jgi:signal peptidase I
MDPQIVCELALEHLGRAEFLTLTVVSGSMSPFLRVGDRIRAAKSSMAQLRCGDIAVVTDARGPLTHRVISILESSDGTPVIKSPEATSFVTKGDANPYSDVPPVTASFLIGLCTAVQRDSSVLDLQSPGVRRLMRAMAKLSAAQPRLANRPPTLSTRVASRTIRNLIPLLAKLAWAVYARAC